MKKRHKVVSVLLTAMTLFASFEAFAANTFTAISGSDWNTAANWSEGVPVAVWHGVLDEDRDRVITGDMKRVEIATTHPDYLGATTAAGGLVAKGGRLAGFAIAGEDGGYAWADGRIDGNRVVLSSPEIPCPSKVRYAWDDDPEVSLFNGEGLPASPFKAEVGK